MMFRDGGTLWKKRLENHTHMVAHMFKEYRLYIRYCPRHWDAGVSK